MGKIAFPPIYYNLFMTRRELLAAGRPGGASTLWARSHMDKMRISAITDEIGLTTDESIAFAHHFGMQFVEIRNPPKNESNGKKEYFALTEAEIKADAVRFAERRAQSFVRQHQPAEVRLAGQRTHPPEARGRRRAREAPGSRESPLGQPYRGPEKAIHCAQIMGCDKIRVFAGSRVADPKTMYSRIAETIGGEMAAVRRRRRFTC